MLMLTAAREAPGAETSLERPKTCFPLLVIQVGESTSYGGEHAGIPDWFGLAFWQVTDKHLFLFGQRQKKGYSDSMCNL